MALTPPASPCESKPWVSACTQDRKVGLFQEMLWFHSSKKNPNNCLQLIFVPCSSGATTHGCPPVVSACQVTNLALGLPPKHPNTSPWPGMTRTNTAVSFPLHKSSSAFFLPPQKRSSRAFFKPSSLHMQLPSGSCGVTSHMRIFSIVLGS